MSRLSTMLLVPPSAEKWEGAWRQGRLLLYALSFIGTAVSVAAVAWVAGQVSFFMALLVLAGLGHVVSALSMGRRLRLSFVIYPVALVAVLVMRVDLLTIIVGGSLFPLARLLAVVQAVSSFNLRGPRSLYDSFLLGLAVILLASEGAMSVDFVVFLLAFGVVALVFLALAHPVSEGQRHRWVGPGRTIGLAMSVAGAVVLTLGTSVAVFMFLPQGGPVLDARPLPSRLDLTAGRPPPPSISPGGDPATWAQFLPSREGESAGPVPVEGSGPLAATEAGGASSRRDSDASASPPMEQGRAAGEARRSSEIGDSSAVDTTLLGAGEAPGDGAGTLFSRAPYVELGYTGNEGKDVVMYVRSSLASFWRGQVLDEYDGRGWKATGTTAQFLANRWGRVRFSDAPEWTARDDHYVQSFFLHVPQPDAVFTGYSPGHIVFGARVEDGDLLTAGQQSVRDLRRADSYRVLSAVPRLTPEALRADSADRRYLPQQAIPYVPVRVKALAESIVAGATSDYDKAARLEQFLLNNYDYDLRVSPLSRSGDVVESFLFERQAGYCAQFATAMAVMARLAGLPARVATGYLPGTYNSLSGAHAVRLQDAHAWVEIKFMRSGWVPFDPTPRPDSPWALDAGYAAMARSLQMAMRAQLRGVLVGGPFSPAGAAAALFGGIGLAWAAGAASAAIMSLLTLGLYLAARRRKRLRRDGLEGYTLIWGGDREEVRDAYGKSLRLLARKGYPQRRPDQSPYDYAAGLRALGLPVPAAFGQITRFATHALYDPQPLDGGAPLETRSQLGALRAAPGLIRIRT